MVDSAPSPDDIKKQCIFCQIVSGKAPAEKIFEDEHLVAVLDIKPAVAGHILLIPKEHYAVLPQVPDQLVAHFFLATKKLSKAMLQGLHVRGTTFFVANGAVAGQRAPHLLMHLIPREKDDALPFTLTPNDSLLEEQKKLKIELVGGASLLGDVDEDNELDAEIVSEQPHDVADEDTADDEDVDDEGEDVDDEEDEDDEKDDAEEDVDDDEEDDAEEAVDDEEDEDDEEDVEPADKNAGLFSDNGKKNNLDDIAGLFK